MDFKKFQAKTTEEEMAVEIAECLEDHPAIPLYISMARQHDHTYLRRVLRTVLGVPDEKIRTTRGALFNWMVQHNVLIDDDDPEDEEPTENSKTTDEDSSD